MRYGAVTAFPASSSVHTTFLRMLLRVPMQSDNSFSMVRQLVRSRPACYSKIAFVSHCNQSSRTTRLRTARCFQTAAEPNRYQTKEYCRGALRDVNQLTSTQIFPCRHVAYWHFETCRRTPRTSVYRGRPEVSDAGSKRRDRPTS